jgi:hypothetical protein
LTGLPVVTRTNHGTARLVTLATTEEMASAPDSEKIGMRSATVRPRSPLLGSSWTAILTNPRVDLNHSALVVPQEYTASPRPEIKARPRRSADRMVKLQTPTARTIQTSAQGRSSSQHSRSPMLAITDEASPFALRSTRNSFRGQQCAEAPLDPGGATKQLPARRHLALEGGLPAEPAWAVERRRRRPQEHGRVSQRAVARRGGPGGPDAGRAFVTLSTSSASVQCPVSGASVQCPRLPVPATGVQCPVPSERPGVRCPGSGVGVRCGRPVSVRCRVRCVRPE